MVAHRNFASRVPHVQPGSPVSAGNTSAATRALESRTNYLREIVDAIDAGMLLVRRDQPLHVDVGEGDAVYWNADTKQYEQALAGVQNDAATGTFLPLPSADCLGICITKSNAVTGVIATLGMVQLSNAVMESMIDGDVIPGRYFLSAANPGKLVRQRPPVTVAVAFVLGPADGCSTASWVFVNPQLKDFLENHIHYQIPLVAAPAGTHVPPVSGEHHTITDPDPTLQGWLPADHATFNGGAPAGARFGYNLAAHPTLNRVWPPLPEAAAVLEMYQPNLAGAESKFVGMQRVQPDYVTINKRGIWWMTSCYNQVPWDTSLDTTTTQSLSSASLSVAADACPADPPVQLLLSFLKMTFATDKTVVTSLQPAASQPIEFVNCDGAVSKTGDLFARLTVAAMLDPVLVRGGVVFKDLGSSALQFKRGWVAEALYAGSTEVVLSGSHQELLDPDQAESTSNPMLHQGIVRVDVQLDPSERELSPQVVRLGDALEREYKGVTYLGFPSGRDSGIRMRFNVPPSGLPVAPKLAIRGLIFGRAAGPFSAMRMSYYRIPRPTAGVPSPVTDGDTTLTFDVVTPSDDYDGSGSNLPVDRAIEVESSQFVIEPGDTVFVTLFRSASASPLFQADIGVIRIGGIVIPGEV